MKKSVPLPQTVFLILAGHPAANAVSREGKCGKRVLRVREYNPPSPAKKFTFLHSPVAIAAPLFYVKGKQTRFTQKLMTALH